MAGKEQSSPELLEKALGSSVFDGKSSGSKRGPSRTHLGVIEARGGLGRGARRKPRTGVSLDTSATCDE